MTASRDEAIAAPASRATRRRYLTIIGVLLVVLILMGSYILISADLFGPKYPNEDTPLELQTWGLTWTMEWNQYINGYVGYNYSSMEIIFRYEDPSDIGGGGAVGHFGLDSLPEVNFTEFAVPSTPEQAMNEYHASTIVWSQNITEARGFFISDDPLDGRFNAGDRICVFRVVYDNGNVSHTGFDEDVVYQIGWMYSDGVLMNTSAYEFVIDDGRLYSWLYVSPQDIWDL